MVCQYTEYAGYPSINDWVKKQFKGGIVLDVDVKTIQLIEDSQGTKKLKIVISN